MGYKRKAETFFRKIEFSTDVQFFSLTPILSFVVFHLKSFFASEKVKVLNHPPYSPDLRPCDFFLFPRLKKTLSGNKYTPRSSLGSAIYQCLQQIPKEDYLSAFRDWVKRLQKCVSVLKVCKKNMFDKM